MDACEHFKGLAKNFCKSGAGRCSLSSCDALSSVDREHQLQT